MEDWIRVLEPVKETNDYGEERTEYVGRVCLAAERVRLTGNRKEEVGEHFADYSAEWNVNAGYEIGEHWRVEAEDGHTYEVTNIISNKRRGYNTIVCQRVNE